MIYHAKAERGLIWLLLVIAISSMDVDNFPSAVSVLALLTITFIVVSIFVTYKFKIDHNCFIYEIKLFHMSLYKAVIYPEQIISIRFQRYGWHSKGAVIKVKKGFRIKLVQFAPENVWDDLCSFASQNDIPSSMTKDFKYL